MIVSFVRKYLGEAILVLGTGILFYNIFNFSVDEFALGIIAEHTYTFAYYYPSEVLDLIAVGSMLVVAGILVIRNK